MSEITAPNLCAFSFCRASSVEVEMSIPEAESFQSLSLVLVVRWSIVHPKNS
jgi:hypothetical protein